MKRRSLLSAVVAALLGWVFKLTPPSPSADLTLKWEPINFAEADAAFYRSMEEAVCMGFFVPHPTYAPDDRLEDTCQTS